MATKKTGRKATTVSKTKASPKRDAKQESNKGDAERNDELKAKIEQIRQMESCATRNDVMARYDIACICREIIDGDGNRYGARAVETASRALVRDPTWFRRQAAVASTWSREQLEKAASLKRGHKASLTWSHFIELARVDDGRKRRKFSTEASKQGMSVCDLKKAIKADAAELHTKPVDSTSKPPKDQTAGDDDEPEEASGGEASDDDWQDEDEPDEDAPFAAQEDSDEDIEIASSTASDSGRDPVDRALDYLQSSGTIEDFDNFGCLEYLRELPDSEFTEERLDRLDQIAADAMDHAASLQYRSKVVRELVTQKDPDRQKGNDADLLGVAAV